MTKPELEDVEIFLRGGDPFYRIQDGLTVGSFTTEHLGDGLYKVEVHYAWTSYTGEPVQSRVYLNGLDDALAILGVER